MRHAISMVLALAISAPAGQAFAQQGDIFSNPKNLQVLPKDISSEELRATMRGFALGLGVRCTHCHVGEEGQPLTTYDFPADAKEPKRIAREMIRMVRSINETVGGLGRGADHVYVEVTCETCHRGQDRPRMIRDVLSQVYDESGGDVRAVIEKYKALREQYYGGHTFDFGVFPVNGLAFSLMGREKLDDAIALFSMNAEYHPESQPVWSGLGMAQEAAGRLEQAAASYRKSLELNPDSTWAAARLKEVEERLARGDD